MRKPISVALCLALSLPGVLFATAEATPDSPQAPGRGRWQRPDRRPGSGYPPGWRPPGQQPPGQRPPAQGIDTWIAQELRYADQQIQQGYAYQARDRIYQVGLTLSRRPEARYRRIASQLEQVLWAIDRNDLGSARSGIQRVLRQLGNGSGNPNDPARQRVLRELGEAVRYLDWGQGHLARRYTLSAYNIMIRSNDWQMRNEANQIRYADQLVAARRDAEAASVIRGVCLRLGNGGGGGGNPGRCRRDRPNRQEWRRDIFDLIDTIQDGNMQMARRDMQTLIRDIRQDGYVWECNREYVRRLNFIAPRLDWPNRQWCVQQLRRIRQDLNY